MKSLMTIMMETIGQLIKRLREEKGLSQNKLAERSGLDRSYINQLENDKVGGITLRTAKVLAAALGVGAQIFLSDTIEPVKLPPKSLKNILSEVQDLVNNLEVLQVPIIGIIPCGEPYPVEQAPLGHIDISRGDLKGISDISKLFALKVSGNSLEGDGIHDGDKLIVDPLQKTIVNGKIYVVRLDNAVCARHVFKLNGKYKLVSSDGYSKEIEPKEFEIQGRIIRRYRSQEL